MKDTPLTREEVQIVQNHIGMIAELCNNPEMSILMRRYTDQARPQYNGTLDTVLLQNMSIKDLEKSKRNLRNLCEMGMRILQISDIRNNFIQQQEKDREQETRDRA